MTQFLRAYPYLNNLFLQVRLNVFCSIWTTNNFLIPFGESEKDTITIYHTKPHEICHPAPRDWKNNILNTSIGSSGSACFGSGSSLNWRWIGIDCNCNILAFQFPLSYLSFFILLLHGGGNGYEMELNQHLPWPILTNKILFTNILQK